MRFQIRAAQQHDLAQIMAIYNAEILTGTATWNETPRTLEYFEQWFEALAQHNFPLLVAVDIETQAIAGYADYDHYSENQGYRFTVEHSIFIDPHYFRHGLAKALMQQLIEHAQAHHKHVMVARIDAENIASIQLHLNLGFYQSGFVKQVGYKFGQWRDLVIMQRIFDNDTDTAQLKQSHQMKKTS